MKTVLALSMFLVPLLAPHLCRAQTPPETPGDGVAAKSNPFFEEWKTPFGVPPFDRIENRHYVPAFERAIAEQEAEIATITGSADAPSFANTIEALDRSGSRLGQVSRVFFGLLSARTDDEMDAIARTVSPMLTRHADALLLDAALFARIRAVYDERDCLDLTVEQRTLLEEYYQDFVRGGANLDEGQKAELRTINEKLSLATLAFGQNILKEDNRFQLVIEQKEDLAGLPERVVEGAAQAAAERKLEGKWLFTLHKPSLIPFLIYSERRELREKMFKGYIERGAHGDDLDNREGIREIIRLRTRKANLLGYETYAAFALSRRVAGEPARVYELLHKLWKPALGVARREAGELQALVDAEKGGFKLEPWDWWYYAEKVRKQRFDLDDQELRPYFELGQVMQGAFEVARRLYGLRFVERTDIPTYHPDVKAFEVLEADGTHRGIFYTDFFPRASKRGGAWCGAYREPHWRDGKKVTPVVNNVGNFSKPTGGKPALLSFEEVNTLFHEFGHALHVLLNDTTYIRTADAVRVDFVELPSQIMENWASEPEVLRMYARHYETGEPIPDALVEKITRSRTFNQGFETVEYLAASFLDMDWHTTLHGEEIDVDGFEKGALDAIGLLPEVVSRYRSPYFRHVFGGAYYAAGYYSYIWAAVLDADAFEAFREKGLFDADTARAFREHVLSKGGSEDQMILYRRFRGADPKIEPLLRRRGLLPAGEGAAGTEARESE
jgi:peptidyl-dipeptidase Dcp